MFIKVLPVDQASKYWTIIARTLAPAMLFEDGKYTLDDVRDFVERGTAQVWIALDDGLIYGAAITQIADYPQKSMLLVLCLAGKDFKLWDNIVIDYFAPYARSANCQGIEFLGRKGWVKRAARLGFKPVHIVYEMAVKDENLERRS